MANLVLVDVVLVRHLLRERVVQAHREEVQVDAEQPFAVRMPEPGDDVAAPIAAWAAKRR
jgi:hypothetical protein